MKPNKNDFTKPEIRAIHEAYAKIYWREGSLQLQKANEKGYDSSKWISWNKKTGRDDVPGLITRILQRKDCIRAAQLYDNSTGQLIKVLIGGETNG